MASWLEKAFVLTAILTVASAACVKPDTDQEKEDKNATSAGESDITKNGMRLKIEISLIYRKQGCFVCLLESMPKVHLLLTSYIRAAILLRVVHQARARAALLTKSFHFVTFIRMSMTQLTVLQQMKWAIQYRPIFIQMNFMAHRVIHFVQGSLTRYHYISLYRKHLMNLYGKVSHILVTSLARWKANASDLKVRRRSLYALMMLTQLLWTERFLYERLINYEGSSSVEVESLDIMNKVKGFFVSTKITFRFKEGNGAQSASSAYKIKNGVPVIDKANKSRPTLADRLKQIAGKKKPSLADRLKQIADKKKKPSLADRLKQIAANKKTSQATQAKKTVAAKPPPKRLSLAERLKKMRQQKKPPQKRLSLAERLRMRKRH